MPIKILMPALSPTMTEGTFVRWHRAKGDAVEAGDLLAEIETDKATMEVEAVDEGTLGALLVEPGTPGVQVGSLLAVLLEDGETEEDLQKALTEQAGDETSKSGSSTEAAKPTPPLAQEVSASPTPTPTPEPQAPQGRIIASPLAKRLAAAKNIPLSAITGTGPRGRIIKRDIEGFKGGTNPVAQATAASAPQPSAPSEQFSGFEPSFESLPLSTMRQVIARRLCESKSFIPHFYLTMHAKVDALFTLRKEINTKRNIKLSINDFVLKATATALADAPAMNSAWAGDHVRRYSQVDLAVAVGLEEGLITPVIRDAAKKSLTTLSQEMRDLASRAREGKLPPQDFQGGTFSVSNLGMYGVSEFSAIINPPQSGILAIGTTEKRPFVTEDNGLRVESVMALTLSVDHRLIDGVVAAQFLSAIKHFLEEPAMMLV